MTILITAVIDLKPGLRDETLRSARPFIEAALAEPGCRAYTWSLDPDLPDRIHVFEDWTNEAALRGHFDNVCYRDMRDHLQAAGVVNARSAKYRVDAIEPVYDDQGRAMSSFSPTARDADG